MAAAFFLAAVVDGLRDEPRSGAPRTVDDARIEAVIEETLKSLPGASTCGISGSIPIGPTGRRSKSG